MGLGKTEKPFKKSRLFLTGFSLTMFIFGGGIGSNTFILRPSSWGAPCVIFAHPPPPSKECHLGQFSCQVAMERSLNVLGKQNWPLWPPTANLPFLKFGFQPNCPRDCTWQQKWSSFHLKKQNTRKIERANACHCNNVPKIKQIHLLFKKVAAE